MATSHDVVPAHTNNRTTAMKTSYGIFAAALLAACAGDDAPGTDSAASDTTARPATVATTPATADGEVTGFDTPESVKYDPGLDMYFVSSINGNPGAADNNGYIARVHPDSATSATRLVEGGRNGVTLNAPKGMAIQGDTLWVADIDVVRGFDRRTGAPVATISFEGQDPAFLNDVAVGMDGIYVTDTNIRFNPDGSMSNPATDRIFRINGRTVSVVAEGDSLGKPNGITWDAANTRFIVAPFNANAIMTWTPGSSPVATATGPGQFDGVEVLEDGRIVVTSWADSAVHATQGSTMTKIVSGVEAPADLGVDTKRRRLLVPHFNAGKVSYWKY